MAVCKALKPFRYSRDGINIVSYNEGDDAEIRDEHVEVMAKDGRIATAAPAKKTPPKVKPAPENIKATKPAENKSAAGSAEPKDKEGGE